MEKKYEVEKMKYDNTLNLPKTDFDMKANLPIKEPKIVSKWKIEDIYTKSLLNKKNEFSLQDGPPYANGDIHMGTAFNKIIKDALLKYKRMQGYRAEFIPGWDCHGLPIELAVLKGEYKDSVLESRKKFKEHALKFVERHKESFARLGILADWDNAYLTLDPKYEAEQLRVFAKMVEKNYLYRALKPVHWCINTRTAISESEIQYKDHISDSIYVKFRADKHLEESLKLENVYFLIWTTTPWTLPANLAIAVKRDFNYLIVKSGNDHLILLESIFEQLNEKLGLKAEIVKRIIGEFFENFNYYHPFEDREGLVILADHIDDTGTGCVHTAPGHGQDDFIAGKKYGLDILSCVDERGIISEGMFKGQFYSKANEAIVSELRSRAALVHNEKITHSYPYSERGHCPIIFRATEQWFVSLDKLGGEALDALLGVKFFPNWSNNRMEAMLSQRPDWCISRQRIWGVPIPAFYCQNCKRVILDPAVIEDVAKIVEEKGSDEMFKDDFSSTLNLKCCGEVFLGKDIFDVWFDSGTSHHLKKEAFDIYLEGSDQHRGWFQTSLLTSVAANGRAPYKTLMTHGFVVDSNGAKMSKSLGNVIAPKELVDKYGADIVRLWACSSDYANDIKISDTIIQQTTDLYRKIRNSIRFILANTNDVKKSKLMLIDELALAKAQALSCKVKECFDNYEIHQSISFISHFISSDMSAFYFDIIKDRLYTHGVESDTRRSAQTALVEILDIVVKILAPIISFTAEEVWDNVSKRNMLKGSLDSQSNSFKESVLLESWPKSQVNLEYEKIWSDIQNIRNRVNSLIEVMVSKKEISTSFEAELILSLEDKILLKRFSEKELKEIFKVADISFEDQKSEVVKKFQGQKCLRCWKYFVKLEKEVCQECKKNINEC